MSPSSLRFPALLAAALLLPSLALAQTPAGATAKCKDGTYSTAKSTQGRCSAHGGVASLVTSKKPSTRSTSTSRSSATSKHTTASTTSSSRTPTSRTTSRRSTSKTAPGKSAPSQTPPPPTSGSAESSQIPTVRAPAGAPAGATALCKDGTYSTSKVHTGACSHHGGVSQWLQ